MRTTIGIEYSRQGMEIVDFIEALNFESVRLQLVNVLEIWNSTGAYGKQFDRNASPLAHFFQQLKDEGHQVLNEVAEHAQAHGLAACDKSLLFGSVSNELLNFSDRTETDLLAIGASGKSRLEGIVLGSTSRKTVINCQQSVLIVKNPPKPGKKELTAVFATDHSPYANECLEAFWKWKPRGIRNIVVLSTYSEQVVGVLMSAIEHFQADVSNWIKESLTKENDRFIGRLKTAGIGFENRVECGDVGDTIADIMQRSQADLLVLGSQGHGFLDRLSLGSVSLEQAVSRNYSVLIMRKQQKSGTTIA